MRIWLVEGPVLRFSRSAVAASLWLDPEYGADDRGFVRAFLRPGDTVVDVGANIGHLALIAATTVGPSGRVLALEAHPDTYRALEANVRDNRMGWLQCRHVAVGEGNGTTTILDRVSDDQNAIGAGETRVPMAPLDELAPVAPVTLLKLDAEGYEGRVLDGAVEVLARTRCIYFEVSPASERYGSTPAAIVDRVVGLGFTVVDPATLRLVVRPIDPTTAVDLCGVRDLEFLQDRLGRGPVDA